ncbi:MAG: hypothetical protein MUE90_03250, partial [Thermoanaerobaculales bacterium]|nr:hypothetical protein [Thermoanaerobaculales bacterium]
MSLIGGFQGEDHAEEHGSGCDRAQDVRFDPPVMPQKQKLLAYKARLRPGVAITGPVVTTANDEGVWGTGPEFSSSGTISFRPTLILREGDATSTAIGAPTYGNGGTLTIN